jgi:hypothetical protein
VTYGGGEGGGGGSIIKHNIAHSKGGVLSRIYYGQERHSLGWGWVLQGPI